MPGSDVWSLFKSVKIVDSVVKPIKAIPEAKNADNAVNSEENNMEIKPSKFIQPRVISM